MSALNVAARQTKVRTTESGMTASHSSELLTLLTNLASAIDEGSSDATLFQRLCEALTRHHPSCSNVESCSQALAAFIRWAASDKEA